MVGEGLGKPKLPYRNHIMNLPHNTIYVSSEKLSGCNKISTVHFSSSHCQYFKISCRYLVDSYVILIQVFNISSFLIFLWSLVFLFLVSRSFANSLEELNQRIISLV